MIYGQVNIHVVTDKKEYYSRDLVQLTVVLEINGADWVQETPIKLPDFSNFYERGTGTAKNSVLNPDNNAVASQLVYQVLLQPKNSGKIKIGSALVKVNGKIYKTEPFDIMVLEKAEKNIAKTTPNDLHFTMEIENTEVYPNQPVIAVVKAHSSNFNNLRKIKNIQPPQPKGIQVYPLELRPSEIEMNRKNQVMQTLAVYMLFPEKSGRLEVSPATISVDNHQHKLEKVNSNATYLNVKKLPTKSPNGFKNAVGNFHLEIKNLDESIPAEIHQPLDILVKLKGKGNINKGILPKIMPSQDYEIFPPKIKEKIQKKKTGLEGEVEAHYILVPKKQGDIQVRITEFSFFNPEEERYVDLGEKSLRIKVDQPLEEQKTTLQKVNDYTSNVMDNVNIPILEDKSKREKESKNSLGVSAFLSDYALFLGAIVGISVCAFIFLRKRKNNNGISEKSEITPENTIADIEAKIRTQQSEQIPSVEELEALFLGQKYEDYLYHLEQTFVLLDKKSKQRNYANFAQELEYRQGKQTSEEYQTLVQQVKTEKYAPCHTHEQMQEIHQRLQSILAFLS